MISAFAVGGSALTGPAAGLTVSAGVAPVIAGVEAVAEGVVACDRSVMAVDGRWPTTGAGHYFGGGGNAVATVGSTVTVHGLGVAIPCQCVPGIGDRIAPSSEYVTLVGKLAQCIGLAQRLVLSRVQLLLLDVQVAVDGEEVITAADRILA